ncbi:hypothetical protein M3B74_20300 [Citrobacter freundii]|jgi:hypothetical protein|uniref:Uncharacterized protein n=1 Tax=Citrobacter pasteurii TaxID=1563222 RepID=A0ABX8KE56_9ENTR|nr:MULTISPECIES: hypothetical protein [Bacteria]TRL71759.1 hypothetical protein FMM65_10315 [Citrobacter youngae]AYY47159.1 hypothetical protein EGX89_00580 [Citrobacter freundii]AZZ88356.1 hypothetical protein [Citrobacter freundii]EIC2134715.1 hypothetical protein [Citrobacter freundii]KAA0562411.1 hypothetical protein F0326_20065 [Citrobacter portucalensis]
MLLLVHKRTSSLEVKFCQASLIAVKNGKEIVKMAVKQRPGVGDASNEKMLRLAAAVRQLRVPSAQGTIKPERKLHKA